MGSFYLLATWIHLEHNLFLLWFNFVQLGNNFFQLGNNLVQDGFNLVQLWNNFVPTWVQLILTWRQLSCNLGWTYSGMICLYSILGLAQCADSLLPCIVSGLSPHTIPYNAHILSQSTPHFVATQINSISSRVHPHIFIFYAMILIYTANHKIVMVLAPSTIIYLPASIPSCIGNNCWIQAAVCINARGLQIHVAIIANRS